MLFDRFLSIFNILNTSISGVESTWTTLYSFDKKPFTDDLSLTLSHEVDEARDHEDWMEVELEIRVVLPGERLPLIAGAVLDDPVEAEGHDAVEQDLRDEDEEAEAAARPRSHAVVLVLPVSES